MSQYKISKVKKEKSKRSCLPVQALQIGEERSNQSEETLRKRRSLIKKKRRGIFSL